MTQPLSRAAAMLAAALTTAMTPLLAQAQATYELKAPARGLVVRNQSTGQPPSSQPLTAPILGAFSVAPLEAGESKRLVPPTSTSPGAWSFTSSDTTVARVAEGILTAVSAGQATITATQAADGDFAAAAVSAEISVASPYLFTVKGAPRLGNASTGSGVPGDASLATTGQIIWPNSGSWLGARFVAQSAQTTFKFAADNILTLYLDGVQVLHSTNWSTWGTITVNTVPGRGYTLSAFVQDFGGSYGFTGNVQRADTGAIILRTNLTDWVSN